MTLVAQVLAFVLIAQAIQEIVGMEEPAVTTYENFLDVDARDEIGPIQLNDTETIIAFETQWSANIPSDGLSYEKMREPIRNSIGRI